MSKLSKKIAELRNDCKDTKKIFWKKDVIYTQLLTLEANAFNQELPKEFYLLHVDMPEEKLVELLTKDLELTVTKTEMVSCGHTYGDAYLVELE